ncbi:MAG: class I SAM-dependent methyltransferase [Kiritimatiellae bacterium]|nr:class I SAM-dependent methyltransferase [Kiritimatiellia bacterium]
MQRCLQPLETDILLDVGGYPEFWACVPQFVARIDTLNLHEINFAPTSDHKCNIRTIVGDGRKLTFADNTYDIVHSNSVIEHVGDWEDMEKFASELLRVGRSVWAQTPAKAFFFEPHYLGLFVHWLPKNIQKKIIRWCSLWGILARPSKEEIRQMVDSTRLLTYAEMRKLFPDCRILTERFLWVFPKSYIAVRRSCDT